jgi:anti-sigma factor ChrR (cupin superfamily)
MAPGVRYTTLGRDPGNRTELMLVTMEPGSLVDEHDHPGVEELYLLAGDCECAGRILGPGDFHRARATSHHGVTRTRRGCRMLVILHHAKAA